MQKFQIFVSSTYEDLRAERDTVVRAVLEMGHIPVGMEMFSAADDEQWKIIQRHIDESDYYVVIVAHRYGSTLPDGESYTRREYEYAVARAVPVLGFLIDPTADWPADRIDKDPSAVAGLDEFRRRVKERMVNFWTNADDLHGKCAVALMKAFTAYPREGWVRATSVTNPAVTAELTRLSAENAQLRRDLEEARAESRAEHDERVSRVERLLIANKRPYDFRRGPHDSWERCEEFDLFDIFGVLAPTLVAEQSRRDIARALAMIAAKESPWDTAAVNQVSGILADLMTFELVELSPRRHSVKDENEYWTLTELGRDVLRRQRHYILEAEIEPPEDPGDAPAEETMDIAYEGGSSPPG
jgi:hypothetical protein